MIKSSLPRFESRPGPELAVEAAHELEPPGIPNNDAFRHHPGRV